MGALSTLTGSAERKPPSRHLRVAPGGASAARCTLAAVLKGTSFILKFNAKIADAAATIGMREVVVDWERPADLQSHADGIAKLRLSVPKAGERGYAVNTSRRMRLHAQFPSRGVKTQSRSVALMDPVVEEDALVFFVPGVAFPDEEEEYAAQAAE